MDKKEVGKLAVTIKKNLSYDGGKDSVCPKCGHLISKASVWVDHPDLLAGVITEHLGMPGIRDGVGWLIECFSRDGCTGNKSKDSKELAGRVTRWLWG